MIRSSLVKGKFMQLRQLSTLIVILVGLFASSLSTALGLGDVTLNSSYNEPLDAEIKLLQPQSLSPDEMLVSLASREDFSRVGLTRDFFLTDLKFQIVFDDPKNPYVKVTSSQPVQEPYLNFLVNLQWPSGRLLREYTLLLDIPLYDNAAPVATIDVPAVAPETSEAEPEEATQSQQPQVVKPKALASKPPRVNKQYSSGQQAVDDFIQNISENARDKTSSFEVQSEEIESTSQAKVQPSKKVTVIDNAPPQASSTPLKQKPQQKPVASDIVGNDTVTVNSGDTLWDLALEMRPARSVSVQQTMMAIRDANPDAFINGNINLLRAGKVLRTPTLSEIENTNYGDAVAAVKQQTDSWQKQSQKKSVISAVSPTLAPAKNDAVEEGRVTLGAANEPSDSNNIVQGVGQSGSGKSLQNELAIVQEELDKSSRENTNLRERIEELEEQINTLENLVTLTNEQLKELEVSTGKQAPSAIDAGQSTASTVTNPEKQADETLSEQVSSADSQQTSSAPEIAAQDSVTQQDPSTPETAVQDSVTQQDPSAPETAVQDSVTQQDPSTPETAVQDRVTQQEAPQVPAEDGASDTEGVNILYVASGALLVVLLLILLLTRHNKKEEESDDFVPLESDIDDEPVSMDFAETEEVNDDFDTLAAPAVEAKTDDVVEEAKIYIELDQLDKAEKLLQLEIQESPDNSKARLALLELHVKAQNVDAFDDQYAQLLPLGDVDVNEQAKSLRDELETDSEFNISDYSTVPESESLATNIEEDSDDEDLLDTDNVLIESLDDLDLEKDLADDESGSSLDNQLLAEDGVSLDTEGPISDSDDVFDLNIDDNLLDSGEELSSSVSDDNTDLDLDLLDSDLDEDLLALSEQDVGDDVDELLVDDEVELDLSVVDDEFGAESGSVVDDLNFDIDLVDTESEPLGSASSPDELDEEKTDTAQEQDVTNGAGIPEFDLDLPPDDVDMESLDQELDEMSALFDEDPLDQDMTETLEELDDISLDVLGDDLDMSESASDTSGLPVDIQGGDDIDDEFEAVDGEVDTKLDLAQAYLDMGDLEGAEDLLKEVVEEGDESQKSAAEKLLQNM